MSETTTTTMAADTTDAPPVGAEATTAKGRALARRDESGAGDRGRTSIADTVVAKIAGIATREVDGVHDLGGATERDRFGRALHEDGFGCQPRGNLVAVAPPAPDESRNVHDRIRDVAADLGLGLVRIVPDHRHIEDIFREEAPR